MKQLEVQDTKPVWIAWTNTDLTEGRGFLVPLAVAETLETATRLGRNKSVQGSDCHVCQGLAIRIDGTWLAPVRIEQETAADKKDRLVREAREAAIARAIAAGLSDDDIAALSR